MKIKEITNETVKVTQVNPSTGEVTYKDDVTNVTTTVPQGAATPVAPGTTEINTSQLQTGQPGQTAQLGVKVGDTIKLGGSSTAGTTAPVAPTGTMGTTSTSETNVSEMMQEISPKLARYYLRKIDSGVDVTDLINDSAELHTMYNDVALMHHLHPDDDFEKIEQIVINDLNDIADSDYEDDFYNADDSDFEQSDEYEFESIKRLAGL